jgi:hypothetical protein
MSAPTKNTGYPAPGERPPNHEYANLFPMLDAQHLDELATDIKTNGQREPIVLLEGQILDGRNRCDACLKIKVDPFYRFYDPRQDGKSPLAFVLSRNLKRRHLTLSQAAAVAAESLPFFEREAKERQQAAGKAHTGNLKKPAASSSSSTAATPPEVVTLVMQARATLPVLRDALKTGKNPNGKPVSDAERTKLTEQVKLCEKVLAEHPEEVAKQEARLRDIDSPPAVAGTTPIGKTPEYSKAVDLIKKHGTISVQEIITATDVPHVRAVEIMSELGRNGMLGGGDEFDQRTSSSETAGHETAPATRQKKPPASGKPSHTMAAALATAKPEKKKAAGSKKATEPKAEKPKGRAPTAAATAGAALGVGERSVRDAAAVKKASPEKFEQVKAGKKSVAAAKKEAERESTEVQDAIGRIREVCGRSLADAVADGTRLPKAKDIVAYAALSNDDMIKIRGLIDAGWDLSRAQKYKAGALSKTHRLHDLIDRAAASGGTFTLELEGYRIDVTRLDLAKAPK